jgi:hypothetical protein
LMHMDDAQLSRAKELTSAIQAFREKESTQTTVTELNRVAPGFNGHLLDFNLDSKYSRLFMKETPEPSDAISIPRVKENETVFAKDLKEAKALDATICEASNRLLCASSYTLDALQSLKDVSDPRVPEYLFRSLCLTSSATSMLEVERHLRPGDRPRVKEQVARSDMPTVIQDVRRATPAKDNVHMEEADSIEATDGGVSFKTKRRAPVDRRRDYPPTYTYPYRGRSPARRSYSGSYVFRRGSPRGGYSLSRGRDDSGSGTSRSRSPP